MHGHCCVLLGLLACSCLAQAPVPCGRRCVAAITAAAFSVAAAAELEADSSGVAEDAESAAAAAEALGAPTPERAAAFLNCEGLGDDFWPQFRSALRKEGPLGLTALHFAYNKWAEWEALAAEWTERGTFNGQTTLRVPGLRKLDGSALETVISDFIDVPVAIQKASFKALFDSDPPAWGNQLAGFLACPVGFVLVQYVIFIVNKVRANLEFDELKENWEGMMNTFGQILGVPSYVLDHLESADWGITSFDMAVNMDTIKGRFYANYEEYCQQHAVPPPWLTSWREDAPMLAALEAGDPQRADMLCGQDSSIPVALIGEHGPTNLDHLSTASAALERGCAHKASSVQVEAGHFFTYLWALEGTAEGGTLRSSLRISWEAFWGEPLTKSQGRVERDGMPRWTVSGAVQALRGWARREPFLRKARLHVCCEPLWLCVLLHAAIGGQRLLVRVSMCLLHAFAHVFGAEELPAFWPLVRSFGADLLPRGAMSAAARISAEMLSFQAGIRPPYVPALSLHVAAAGRYSPTTSDVLLFRFRLPSAPGFIRVLRLLAAEAEASGLTLAKIVEMDPGGKSLSFQEIGQFRALAMLPHVPYALRLPDVFALGSPTLVPAEPLLHKFVWPFAGPFCGRTDPDLSRSVDPVMGNTSGHPFSPFDFQGKIYELDRYHNDRRYWAQFTEWERWPHLLRFRSARELLQKATMTEAQAREISTQVREHHVSLVAESLAYWQAAALSASDV